MASQKRDEGRSRKKEEVRRRARERERQKKREEATRSAHTPIVCFAAVAASDFDASSYVPLCSFSSTVCADIIGLSSAP